MESKNEPMWLEKETMVSLGGDTGCWKEDTCVGPSQMGISVSQYSDLSIQKGTNKCPGALETVLLPGLIRDTGLLDFQDKDGERCCEETLCASHVVITDMSLKVNS